MPNDTRPLLLCVDRQEGSEALARSIAERTARCTQTPHILYVRPKGNRPAVDEAQARRSTLEWIYVGSAANADLPGPLAGVGRTTES